MTAIIIFCILSILLQQLPSKAITTDITYELLCSNRMNVFINLFYTCGRKRTGLLIICRHSLSWQSITLRWSAQYKFFKYQNYNFNIIMSFLVNGNLTLFQFLKVFITVKSNRIINFCFLNKFFPTKCKEGYFRVFPHTNQC